MDKKQFIKDILTLNIPSLKLRWRKLRSVLKRKRRESSGPTFAKGKDIFSIPVIINNRNRLTFLKLLLNRLETDGFRNIIILDNDSTYPPLLGFYKLTSHRVILLGENTGHLALWKSGVYKEFEDDYYIYSDPDVVPDDNCPRDYVQRFMELLKKYPSVEKVGFGLRIDDLPDHYSGKEKVISWEKQFWLHLVEKDVYDAGIDTTFALYRPYTNGVQWVQKAYRTGGNYLAKHLPWYVNSSDPGEEEIYYREHIRQGASHWINKEKNG